ncbi:MAG: hypothetical protein R3232_06590, partial [Clostridia bacterium]|nr:hypothetical protein [Clostridia bacterium]
MTETFLDMGVDAVVELKQAIMKLDSLGERKRESLTLIKHLNKEINTGINQMETEIAKAVRTKRAVIEEKYDKQINSLIAKKGSLTAERSRTKKAAVSDRIKNETNETVVGMHVLKKDWKVLARRDKLPLIVRSRLFSALYLPKRFKDFLVILVFLAFILFLIPCGIYFLWLSDRSYLYLALLYVLTILLFGGIHLGLGRLKTRHASTLAKIKELRTKYDTLRRELRKERKAITKDSDESMYGLGEYDTEIREIDAQLTT